MVHITHAFVQGVENLWREFVWLLYTYIYSCEMFVFVCRDYDEETVAYEFPSGASAWQSYGTQQHYRYVYTCTCACMHNFLLDTADAK